MENQPISVEDFASSLLAQDESQPNLEPETDDEQDDANEVANDDRADDEQDEQDEGDDAQSQDSDEDAQDGQANTAPPDDVVITWQTATGETFEAPLAELKAGYMRDADYRQKTMSLAEDRKQAEQALQEKIAEAERYTADLGKLATIGEQIRTYETWLAQAAQNGADPQAIAQAQAQYLLLRQQHEDARAALLQKRAMLTQQSAQEAAQQFEQSTREALAHLEKIIPAFNTEKHIPALREYGLKVGFTPDELAQVSDKRYFEVLYKASQWDALQAKRPEAVARAKAAPPRTTKAGTSSAPPSALERAQKQFKAKKDARSLASLLAASDFI